MFFSLRGLIIIVAVMIVTMQQLAAQDVRKATQSSSDIYRTASKTYSTIKTVKVVYDLNRTMLQNLPLNSLTRPITKPSRITVVYLGDERRYLDEVSSEFGVEPYNRRLGFFNGDVTLRYMGGTLNITEGKDSKECEANDCYCTNFLNLVLSDRDRADQDNSFLYPHCIRPGIFSDTYRVLTDQEYVNGCWCHVLDLPYKDKIWVDVERGCAMVRRETYSGSKTDVIKLIALSASSLMHVKDGLWAPMKATVDFYPGMKALPEKRNEPYLRYDVDVNQILINESTEQDIRLDIPTGTIVNDRNQKSYQLDGTNVQLLEHYAQLSRTISNARNYKKIILWVNILIVIFGIAYFFYRYQRRGRHGGSKAGPLVSLQDSAKDATR
jgi:hypothetical protein